MSENTNAIPENVKSSSNSDSNLIEAQCIPQYVICFFANLGALLYGLVIGWQSILKTSNTQLIAEYDINLSTEEESWIVFYAIIGSAVTSLPIGLLSDVIGRKASMLMLVVPTSVGWGFIIWAQSAIMIMIGRFLTGFSGAFCFLIPLYTSELAEKNIRGSLGCFYELFLKFGLILSFLIHLAIRDIYWISIIFASAPLIFCGCFAFMPETPIYYLKNRHENDAMGVLVKLRGLEYNSKLEFNKLRDYLEYLRRFYGSRSDAIKTKAALKGLVIVIGLIVLRLLTEKSFLSSPLVNTFSSAKILKDIYIYTIEIVAVLITIIIVDKVGRRIILMISVSIMFLSSLAVAICFYLNGHGTEIEDWIPFLSYYIYIFAAGMGLGPIPWLLITELFTPIVQGLVGCLTACFYYAIYCLILMYEKKVVIYLENYIIAVIISVICFVGVLFVSFAVIETKRKSLHRIQMIMDVRWI